MARLKTAKGVSSLEDRVSEIEKEWKCRKRKGKYGMAERKGKRIGFPGMSDNAIAVRVVYVVRRRLLLVMETSLLARWDGNSGRPNCYT
jgi:hypothetical protein